MNATVWSAPLSTVVDGVIVPFTTFVVISYNAVQFAVNTRCPLEPLLTVTSVPPEFGLFASVHPANVYPVFTGFTNVNSSSIVYEVLFGFSVPAPVVQPVIPSIPSYLIVYGFNFNVKVIIFSSLFETKFAIIKLSFLS